MDFILLSNKNYYIILINCYIVLTVDILIVSTPVRSNNNDVITQFVTTFHIHSL